MQSTLKRLEAQFPALIPIEVVRANFFHHLSTATFARRARAQDLEFPVIRTDKSQKAQMMVHVEDLAAYLEGRREVAVHEHKQMSGATIVQRRIAKPLPAGV
jgi:hypothetical protein